MRSFFSASLLNKRFIYENLARASTSLPYISLNNCFILSYILCWRFFGHVTSFLAMKVMAKKLPKRALQCMKIPRVILADNVVDASRSKSRTAGMAACIGVNQANKSTGTDVEVTHLQNATEAKVQIVLKRTHN